MRDANFALEDSKARAKRLKSQSGVACALWHGAIRALFRVGDEATWHRCINMLA